MDYFSSKMIVFCVLMLSVVTAQSPPQPDVIVTPETTLLNEGEDYVVYCNFPGIETLDMVNTYPAEWHKGNTRLTYLSSVDAAIKDKRIKVEVKAQPGNSKNLTAVLTIQRIKATDEGTYTCKVKDRRDNTKLEIRKPIQKLDFQLELNSPHKVTITDQETPKAITIDHGEYEPRCTVEGGFPEASVMIHLGDTMLQGKKVNIPGKDGVQFIANKVQLSGRDDNAELKCMASVPGLTNSQVHRGFKITVRKLEPKFRCDNSSAMIGNRRHVMVCYVSNVQNIDCKDIIWENTDTNEQYKLGQNIGAVVTCTPTDDTSATTQLEISEVKPEHFKTAWAVLYKFDHGDSDRFITTINQISAASSIYGITSMILSLAAVVLLL